MARKPEYQVKAMNKETGEKSQSIGGAWVNEKDSSISIKLNPFIVLASSPNLLITLFPTNEAQKDTNPLW